MTSHDAPPGLPDAGSPALAPAGAPLRAAVRRLSPATVAALFGLLLLCAGLAGAGPVVSLLGVAGTATAVAGRRLPLDLAVVTGTLGLLSAAVLTGLAAGHLGVDLLSRPAVLASGLLAGAVAVAAWSLLRPAARSPRTLPGSGPRQVAAMLPLTAVSCAVAQVVVPGLTKSWAFWGTDTARQMTALAQVQTDGALDYRVSTYPRGLHVLAALVSVPDAPLDDRSALLGYDAVLVASLTWLGLALFLISGTALTVRVVDRLGLRPVVGLVAALLLTAGALLTNTFLHSFVYAGAAASLVAVAVLQALLLVLLETPRGPARLVVGTVGCAVAAFLVAHLWQALLPGPVAVWLVCVAPVLRRLPDLVRTEAGRRGLLLAVLVGGLCVAAAADPLLGVQQAAGLAYAAVPGTLAGSPWRLLVAGLTAVAALAVTRVRSEWWVRGTVALVLGLFVAAALLLHGTGNPTDLGQYYPMKAGWLLALALAPVLAAVAAAAGSRLAVAGWRLVGRTGRPAFVLRALLVGALAGPGLAFWTGYLVGQDPSALTTWHRAAPAPAGERTETLELSAVRYDVALRYGRDTDRAVVPWDVGVAPFAPEGSMTTSLLLTFLTGQPEMPTGRIQVCDAVAAIAGSTPRPAVVLTQYPVPSVRDEMAKGGCAGRARVLAVPNVGYRD